MRGAGGRGSVWAALRGRGLIVAIAVTGVIGCSRQEPWDGDWVMRFRDQNLIVLHLDAGQGAGALRRPRNITFDNTGAITDVRGGLVEWPLTIRASGPDSVQLVVRTDHGDDRMELRLGEAGSADLMPEGLPDWMAALAVERPAADNQLQVGTDWEEHLASPELEALRDRLLEMVAIDQEPRLAVPMDMEAMQRIDAEHRPEVVSIFEKYGWPGYSLVGRRGSNAFSILVQHQDAELHQKILPALQKAAEAGDASMESYALLYDRTMHELGRPQRWGTQGGDCAGGKATIAEPVEDPENLEARRAEIHLLPLDMYLEMLQGFCDAMPK